MRIKKEKIKVYEMTCTTCENRVEKAISKLEGITSAKASYSEQHVEVEYDNELCSIEKIKAAIKDAGYSTQSSNDYKVMGIFLAAAAVILLGLKTSGFDMEAKLQNASYAVLFVVGVLTSIHCIGMCGGIMLSQSLSGENKNNFDAMKPAILYNLGRVISYTILGGIVGAIGSVFSLSITAKAALQIIAGLFMIAMGFNMAGFSTFRKLSIKLPFSVCKAKNQSKAPFVVGLLNGFMPCGPLQTMQLFALGTGSALSGALSMFMFSIGTVPLMLTFGALSGLLSKGYTKRILKVSGILVIILGVIMGNRGLALAGVNINPMTAASAMMRSMMGMGSSSPSGNSAVKATLQDGVQIINMTADNNGYTPNAFYVQKGIPVKWIIDGKELNSCNNAVVVPSQNIQQKLKKGENVIEFTPGDKDINFSCWMGMIQGVIKVTDQLDSVDTSKADPSLPPASTGPSCCAAPLEDESSAPSTPSIYGSDITKVPTEKIVNKATVTNNRLSAVFKGVGYEFEPLIVITDSSKETILTFDLNKFDNAEGKYLIVDAASGKEITSFTGKKGLNEIAFNPQKAGGYAVLKDNNLLGIIEVNDDLKSANIESIRAKYLP